MSLGETGMVIADGAGVEMRNVGVSAHEYTGSADNTALLIEDCFELYFSGCSFSAPTNGSDRTVASQLRRFCCERSERMYANRDCAVSPPSRSLCLESRESTALHSGFHT